MDNKKLVQPSRPKTKSGKNGSGTSCWLKAALMGLSVASSPSSAQQTKADEAGCFAYGDVLGKLEDYGRSDEIRVKKNTFDKNSSDFKYVGEMRYFFEGSAQIQFVYFDSQTEKEDSLGWVHGSGTTKKNKKMFEKKGKDFQLVGPQSRLLKPVAYFNNRGALTSISFDEVYVGTNGRLRSEAWHLTSFEEDAIKKADFEADQLRSSNKLKKVQESQVCLQANTLSLTGVQIVGFVSSKPSVNSNKLSSIQAIYYSTNKDICKCLNGEATVTATTVLETERDTELVGNIFNEPVRYEQFLWGFFFTLFVCVTMCISLCCCLFLANYRGPSTKLAWAPEKYHPVFNRLKQRNDAMDHQIRMMHKGIRMVENSNSRISLDQSRDIVNASVQQKMIRNQQVRPESTVKGFANAPITPANRRSNPQALTQAAALQQMRDESSYDNGAVHVSNDITGQNLGKDDTAQPPMRIQDNSSIREGKSSPANPSQANFQLQMSKQQYQSQQELQEQRVFDPAVSIQTNVEQENMTLSPSPYRPAQIIDQSSFKSGSK